MLSHFFCKMYCNFFFFFLPLFSNPGHLVHTVNRVYGAKKRRMKNNILSVHYFTRTYFFCLDNMINSIFCDILPYIYVNAHFVFLFNSYVCQYIDFFLLVGNHLRGLHENEVITDNGIFGHFSKWTRIARAPSPTYLCRKPKGALCLRAYKWYSVGMSFLLTELDCYIY